MKDSYLDVYLMLRETLTHLRKELRKKIEEEGITWQQFHALYHITEDGVRSNELAKELRSNASNMTGLVDRMSEHGWVYREHSKKDRRVWLVKLTEKGSDFKNRLLPKHRNNIAQRMTVLNEDEMTELKRLLTKLKNGEVKEDKS